MMRSAHRAMNTSLLLLLQTTTIEVQSTDGAIYGGATGAPGDELVGSLDAVRRHHLALQVLLDDVLERGEGEGGLGGGARSVYILRRE